MIFWAIVAGALIGLSGAGGTGLVLGAMGGAAMGAWLQTALRDEIAVAIRRALASQADHGTRQAHTPPAEPAAQAAPQPAADPQQGLAEAWALEQARADEAREAEARSEAAERQMAAPAPDTPTPHTPTIADEWFAKARDWLLGGNTIVRVGLVILFVGLTFLARAIVHAGLFPIEARLALVGLAGAGLLAVGFNRRVERPAFGLACQGTGVAVMYLTVFAAAKVFGLMPPLAAFGLMIVFAGLGCALALLQDARGLAFASFLGGYAVPVLIGGHARTPLGLFTYITILNCALLVIAYRKSWRELNLLGFFATFGTATAWGITAYGAQNYLICQVFLGLSVAIFLAAAVFYAHNTPGPLGRYADSTLLFGPALAGFGLEMGLVAGRPFGAAFAALAFAAVYIGVAAYTMRQRRDDMRLMNECLLAIGVGFVTLAVPLALDAHWTSAAWGLEGAGAFWVGARQARWMPRGFGLVLQGVAALVLLSALGPSVWAWPLANNGFMGPMLVAMPLMFTAWAMRRALPHSGSAMARAYAEAEWALRHLVFLGGFALVVVAVFEEVMRKLPAMEYPFAAYQDWHRVLLFMLGVLAAMGLAEWFGRRKAWPTATWPARGSLPLLWLSFPLAWVMEAPAIPLADVAAWLIALGAHYAMLARSDRGADAPAKWNRAVHAGGVWLLTLMVVRVLFQGIERGGLWGTSWSGVVFLISAVGILAALTGWAGRAASLADTAGLRWPLHPAGRCYWWRAALPLAGFVYLGALAAALKAQGVTDPLPYLPLVNPVDLSVAAALLVLLAWRRMLAGAQDVPALAAGFTGKGGLVALGLLGFAAINGVWLRTAHHWLGVAWGPDALGASPVVQGGLSILWTLVAMGLMVFAHARALRLSWSVGAGLLGVVVAKLLAVDMANAQGWERIVAFIGVGVLMLVIGYFVPLPPKQEVPA